MDLSQLHSPPRESQPAADGEILPRDLLVNTPQRRVASVDRYFSTASAKRRKVKEEHCHFCNASVPGKDLVGHLEAKPRCHHLYVRALKVTSEKDLINKLFICEFCFEEKRSNFKDHVMKKRKCLESYLKKFQLKDTESLLKKVKNMRRAAYASRSSTARALETKKLKKRCAEDRLYKSQASSLNDYRSSNLLSNFKLCIVCNSNFSEFAAKEIKEHEGIFEKESLDSPSKKSLRRMQHFHICNRCKDESQPSRPTNVESKLSLSEIANGGKILFFPSNNINSTVREGNDTIEETNITVMFPKKSDAVDGVAESHAIKNQSEHASSVYETKSLERRKVFAAYENELFKFKYRKQREDKFVGAIKDFGKKTLSCVQKVEEDFKIAGCPSWFHQQMNGLKFRKDLFGAFFITFSIELPRISLDTLATCLTQEGFVVTIEKKGSATGEFYVSYMVHTDHKSNDDCSEECKSRVDLKTFLENENFDFGLLGNRYIGTYSSSVQQKLNAFVKHIIKAPLSGLCAQNHHVMLSFDYDNLARIVGIIWPTELEPINLDMAEGNGNLSKKADLATFIDRNISVSCDPRILRRAFKITDSEAEEISNLVKLHQIHLSEDSAAFELPSLDTIVTEPSSSVNHHSAKMLTTSMTRHLASLSRHQKMTLSTYDWLDLVWAGVTGEISEDNKFLVITFSEEEEFFFEIDERLSTFLGDYSTSPLTAAYHYALSCHKKGQEVGIILKRIRISECFTKPFNPLFMKAANSSVVLGAGCSLEMFESLMSRRKCEEMLSSQLEDSNLIFSHQEVSLLEAFFSFDKHKRRSNSSTVVSFVNAKARRQVCFRKVSDKSNENFKIEGSNDEYEMLSSIISRHYTRINGRSLLLAETCSWFEYVGQEKSTEIFETYKDAVDKISSSEVPFANPEDENEMMPEFLICRNGDVLKKRSKQGVLMYPQAKTSFDMMYSRLMLFYPLEREDDLFEGDISELFFEKHSVGEGTVVDVNEKILLKLKIQKAPTLPVRMNQDDQSGVASNDEHEEVDGSDAALDYLIEAMEDEGTFSEESLDDNYNSDKALDCLIEALDEDDQ